jgi:hypothetical protein
MFQETEEPTGIAVEQLAMSEQGSHAYNSVLLSLQQLCSQQPTSYSKVLQNVAVACS